MKLQIIGLASGLMCFAVLQTAHAGHHHSKGTKFERPYGSAGCGLGSLVVGKHGGGQIFAATTNATSYSQYFGITSGTSNCVDDPNNEVASRLDRFVIANQTALESDIAKGRGETISGLAQVMGCSSAADASLGVALRENFGGIYPVQKNISANEVTDAIITVVKQQPAIAVQCSRIRS